MKKLLAMKSLKRTSAIFQAAVIALAALLPAVLLSDTAYGDQLGARYIDMSASQASEGSGRDGGDAFGQNVTYTVSFDVTSAHTNLEGIVIHFCTDSPIVGDACTDASTNGFDLATPTLTANTLGGATDVDPSGWTVGGDNTDYIIISDATGLAAGVGDTVAFDIDGITNPTSVGSFYARITTFTVDTNATAYTGVATSPGTFIDEGGIALSVANELTVTARVQEVLEFCVGTEDDSADTGSGGLGNNGAQNGSPTNREASDDCSDVAGTALSLGVVDSSSIQRTSDSDIGQSGVAGDGNDGVAMIRTNASSGAVMYYKAEQASGVPLGGEGALRIAGVNDCDTDSEVDNACFNSAGGDVANPSQSTITLGTELFGVTLTNQDESAGGNTTDALSCNAEYNGAGSCDATEPTEYAWDPTGAFDVLASSSGPIDDEMVNLEFAATASPTTPTGLYTVTANFVATATF